MLIVTDIPPLSPAALAKLKPTVTYANVDHGAQWKGIRHADLLSDLRHQIGLLVRPVGEPACWPARNGGDVHACFKAGTDWWCGVSASNVGRGQLRVYAGLVENGTRLVSDCVLGGKYTTRFDLVSECQSLAAGWLDAAKKTDWLANDFKRLPLTNTDVGIMLTNAARQKCLWWRQIPKIESLYKDAGGRSAWDLLAAYSLGATSVAVPDQMRALLKFRTILGKRLERVSA